MKTMQNYATCIQIALLIILKLKIFIILKIRLKKRTDLLKKKHWKEKRKENIAYRINQKSDSINESWIIRKDYDIIRIIAPNIYLSLNNQ